MTRIAINGFGRIGRNVLRALLERDSELEVVAVNDLTEPAALARLLAFDTTAGRLAPAEAARAHLDAGATKVLVGAPSAGADVTIAYGVNTGAYDPGAHTI